MQRFFIMSFQLWGRESLLPFLTAVERPKCKINLANSQQRVSWRINPAYLVTLHHNTHYTVCSPTCRLRRDNHRLHLRRLHESPVIPQIWFDLYTCWLKCTDKTVYTHVSMQRQIYPACTTPLHGSVIHVLSGIMYIHFTWSRDRGGRGKKIFGASTLVPYSRCISWLCYKKKLNYRHANCTCAFSQTGNGNVRRHVWGYCDPGCFSVLFRCIHVLHLLCYGTVSVGKWPTLVYNVQVNENNLSGLIPTGNHVVLYICWNKLTC